ncbi:MAG: hypothetical protein VX747_03800, partial [Actinomycetota bacterium]|nr:hypothetical protein [Actinomycetota bacterium]
MPAGLKRTAAIGSDSNGSGGAGAWDSDGKRTGRGRGQAYDGPSKADARWTSPSSADEDPLPPERARAECAFPHHRLDGESARVPVPRDRCRLCTPEDFCQEDAHKDCRLALRKDCRACQRETKRGKDHATAKTAGGPTYDCATCGYAYPAYGFLPTENLAESPKCLRHAEALRPPRVAKRKMTQTAQMAVQTYCEKEHWAKDPALAVVQDDPCRHCGAALLKTTPSHVPGRPAVHAETSLFCCKHGKT